jgi:glycosyltransferase involved in cell wall biosynthesis
VELFLSVIIPAFNIEDYITDAIRSIQAQRIPEVEIIVIDDTSTDRTAAAIRPLEVDKRLRFITNSREAHGPSGCRNTGLRIARGKYIGFLDGDDLWHPEKARRHIEVMESQPGIDLTFSRWRTIDEEGHDTGRISRVQRKKYFQIEDLLKENLVGGASNVICRKSALDKVGLFDLSLRAAVDLDLWLRIARLRERNICFINDVLTEYRLREGQITKDWRRMAENWEIVFDRLRAEMPERVAEVERMARANHLRYRSYLAYEAGDFASSRKLLAQAFAMRSASLLADSRTWITTGAVLGSLLPEPFHKRLASMVKGLRARFFARRTLK